MVTPRCSNTHGEREKLAGAQFPVSALIRYKGRTQRGRYLVVGSSGLFAFL